MVNNRTGFVSSEAGRGTSLSVGDRYCVHTMQPLLRHLTTGLLLLRHLWPGVFVHNEPH